MRITQLWTGSIIVVVVAVVLILHPVVAQEIQDSGDLDIAETPILTPIVTAVSGPLITSTIVPDAGPSPAATTVFTASLALTPVSQLRLPADDFTTWRAEYFNNLTLSGNPALVREEPTIDHVWYANSPAPGIIDTDFSARWTRNIRVSRSGNYRVVLDHDDGGRVWIDGSLVLDAWDAGQWVTHTADIYLTAGEHSFQVAIFDEWGWAAARFSLQPLSFTGWRGEYFNNDSLSEWMAFVRDDNEVDFDWGYGSPAPNVVPSSYSARWMKDIQIDTAGLYRITVSHDDGARVWIDNHLMLDRWTTCCVLDTLQVNLSQGSHNFRIEYNNITGAGSIRFTLNRVEQVCSSALDLVLVLDGSGSINGSAFAQVKQFSRNLVAAFDVGPNSAHIGVVQFAGEGTARIESVLSDNAYNIISAIDSMSQLSGNTDIQEGLHIGQSLITSAGRPQVQHVLILLSDGGHNSGNQDPVSEAERIKAAGTIIFAIAIGQTNINLMNAIASDPDSQHVFMVDDLGGLMNILTSLVTTTCPPTPTPTATPTPTSTPTPAPFDAAELASQSEYLTVAPGAAISPWIVVRNTGTTTWTPAQYGYNGKGALQGTTGYITRNVAPGDTYRVFWNLNAPTTPGVYDYGFVLRHGTQEFGPYFFVRVTVVGYTISGRVVDTNGAGISGATIRADSSHTATTDSAGNYTLSGLLAGTYTLQPSKGGYAFCPVSRRIIVSSNVSNQDFAGFGATVALGFCPNINGYSFRNADFPGFPRDDLREIDLIQMFGRDKVCWTNDSGCNIKPQAAFWQALMNLNMFFGHCDGMASTSLRFFKELDLSQSFHPGASTAHELALEEVRHHVAYYFVEQFTDPISTYKDQIRQNTPSVILNQLRSAMQSGAPNPTTLFVRQAGEGGHTVTPFAIEDKGGGISWVRVYDNNHPDDLNRYVVIDTANEFWSYRAGTTTTWTGGTGTMGIVPITLYGEQPVCPWCGGSQERAASDNPVMQEVELSGSGHLLVTDAQGRRLGYTGAQFHSEIPGAYSAFIDGGLGIELEPIYKLPLGDGYTILLDGQTVNQPENVAVTQFGPGYAAQVDNVRLQQSVRDYVTISANGSQITYRPNERRAPSLVLAVDDASASYELNVANAEINANQQVSVAVQNNDGRLVYNNAQSSGGHYGLFIRRVSSNGVRLFAHSGLTVAAGDTHYAEYRSWNGRGSMTLQIDHGSNGTIDETLILANEVKRVYLPSIMR